MLQLKKFPDIPVSTREKAQASRPHPEEPLFRLLAREVGSFPCLFGKESLGFRRISRGRALHRKGERNSRVVPHSQSPPDVSVHSRETCFPALPRLSSSRSTYPTVARGTALWESLVGKPHGKASRESHRSLDPREGKRDTAATAREESARAYPHSRRGLTPLGRHQKPPRSMSALERNPQVPTPTPHKVLGPGIDGRGNPRGPRATRMGTGLS